MNRTQRAAAGFAAALAVCVAFAAHGAPRLPKLSLPSLGAAPAAAQLPPGQWPQAVSDIAADPDIRFGALPNGMRYAIRRQATPPGQAALRLRIDAGSLMEADDQQGLAHFLEHMAFNGSKAVPEGDMVKILERLGLAFGADTNASTSFDETVYKLDLPRTDDETVDTSLMLLRETAGNLLIEQGAVDRERGVVLSEERARDTPAYRVYKQRQAFLLRGQLPPERLPIGKVEVLESAPAARITDFYKAYYRPERAVLVAVGDFDVDAMEAKIRKTFGDWQGAGSAGGDPELGPVAPRKAEAELVVEAGAPPSLQLAWVGPPDRAADTAAKRRRDLIERLGFSVLNRRFSSLGRAAEPPFLGAAAFKGDEYDAARVTMITVNVQQDRWRQALQAIDQEQRRAVRYGVRQDELDREVEELRAALRAEAAGAATRRPAAIAGEIVASLDEDEVVTSPAQDLAFFEETVKGLRAEQVSAALKEAFDGDGPLLFMTSPAAIEGGERTVLGALEESRKVAVAPPAAPSQLEWPYASFGAPGKVAEEREVADMDAVLVRFENGVRLTVKPTHFRDDEVLVRVNVADGMLDLPPGRQSMAWASGAFTEGGLGKISAEDMERVLASKVYGARFGVTDNAFVMSGSTRPEHLDTQLEVLAAYLAEPGWRPQAFQRIKTAGATIHDQYEATDSGVLARDLAGLLHGRDRRWTFPSRTEIAQASLDDLKAQIAGPLSDGPIEVVVVGDVTVEKAIEAVARTFGALPPRPQHQPPPAAQSQVGFPAGAAAPVALIHKGRKDQAIGYIAWPTTDFFTDPQGARDTAVMAEVMRLRLTDELREAQGATYSPSVNYSHSLVWPGWGYVAASVEVPPERLPAFFADARKIAADLAAKEVSADELERAKAPRMERIEKARQTNEYWLSELSGAQDDPRRLDAIRAALPGTERVSAADVRKAAQAWLREDRAWTLEVRPER
ncbi:MAG: M16 family metallopeptidase [Phenylobacterium sp.]|uniref:M16 family metallopeptidase n=1 Tax=Phenylobacterium sp. TaxID=1871053 RepID=UPI00391B5A7D